MSRVLIVANSSRGLFGFRKELLMELLNPGCILDGRKAEKAEVYVALPSDEYVYKLEELGCKCIETKMNRRGINPLQDLSLLFRYISVVKKVKPDVVLTYTIKPNSYMGIICGIKGIKYIPNITGIGTSMQGEGLLSKFTTLMYRLGLMRAYKVFFQNEGNKSTFEKRKIVKDNTIVIPGSGVNLVEHNYAEYPIEKDVVKFLFVGRIMRDKGIGEFLDCAEYFKEKHPNTEFSVLGSYDEISYEERVNKLHNRGIIYYYGYQDDVPSFIESHHALILPSYHEGLSNVLLEAASTGRPVIASDIPGCRETFDEGISGIGFNIKDSQSLIDAVEKFYNLPYEEKRQMGINGRNKIEREFDRKLVVSKYIETIENIVK